MDADTVTIGGKTQKVTAVVVFGSDGSGNPVPLPGSRATVLTTTANTVTTSGTIAAGAVYYSLILSEDFVGTIDNAALSGAKGEFYDVPMCGPGETHGAINYTISAGEVIITRITRS